MSVPSSPMSVYLPPHTPRRAQHGSTLKVDLSSVELLSYHQEPHEKTGRSSELYPNSSVSHYHTMTS
jgi:hypothetical protein